MADAAVVATGIKKSYPSESGPTPVLRGIDLEVQKGRCVFLAGPSGSGKSTLLSILGCVLTPDEGVLSIGGQDIKNRSVAKLSRVRRNLIGFVFQRFNLVRGLNAADNVAMPLIISGVSAGRAKKTALELLDHVGMSDFAMRDPRKMSGGQCQRIAIARALATKPQIILADEPTAALDAANGQQVMTLFRSLIDTMGATAIVVTHDERIFDFADKVWHMEDGMIT